MRDHERFWFGVVLMGLVLGSTATETAPKAVQDAWRRIRYGQATEADFIRDFGKPSEVRLFFADFTSMRQSGRPSAYRLAYPRGGDDSLLVGGPLGEAWDGTVTMSPQGIAWRVEWRYLEGLRLHTRTKERSTSITLAQIEALAGGSPVTVSKCRNAVGELIQGDCGSYQFDVTDLHLFISYVGPGTDINVSVEARQR